MLQVLHPFDASLFCSQCICMPGMELMEYEEESHIAGGSGCIM